MYILYIILWGAPGKLINMEPKNHPIKQKFIFQTSIFGFKMLIFQSVRTPSYVSAHESLRKDWHERLSRWEAHLMSGHAMSTEANDGSRKKKTDELSLDTVADRYKWSEINLLNGEKYMGHWVYPL